jgi:ribosomal protein S11
MVEAIEDSFIPVVVYNNKAEDAAILKAFGEPSWNNPIVRFLDQNGKDLIRRKAGVWSISGLAARMIASLKAANQKVPKFLETVSLSWQSKFRRATFAMS